jgi:hypothetical protein
VSCDKHINMYCGGVLLRSSAATLAYLAERRQADCGTKEVHFEDMFFYFKKILKTRMLHAVGPSQLRVVQVATQHLKLHPS